MELASGRLRSSSSIAAALEQQLSDAGVDVVRLRRSRIVNRAKVAEIAPSRGGDFCVKTSDGSELKGSRRYRRLRRG